MVFMDLSDEFGHVIDELVEGVFNDGEDDIAVFETFIDLCFEDEFAVLELRDKCAHEGMERVD